VSRDRTKHSSMFQPMSSDENSRSVMGESVSRVADPVVRFHGLWSIAMTMASFFLPCRGTITNIQENLRNKSESVGRCPSQASVSRRVVSSIYSPQRAMSWTSASPLLRPSGTTDSLTPPLLLFLHGRRGDLITRLLVHTLDVVSEIISPWKPALWSRPIAVGVRAQVRLCAVAV